MRICFWRTNGWRKFWREAHLIFCLHQQLHSLDIRDTMVRNQKAVDLSSTSLCHLEMSTFYFLKKSMTNLESQDKRGNELTLMLAVVLATQKMIRKFNLKSHEPLNTSSSLSLLLSSLFIFPRGLLTSLLFFSWLSHPTLFTHNLLSLNRLSWFVWQTKELNAFLFFFLFDPNDTDQQNAIRPTRGEEKQYLDNRINFGFRQ